MQKHTLPLVATVCACLLLVGCGEKPAPTESSDAPPAPTGITFAPASQNTPGAPGSAPVAPVEPPPADAPVEKQLAVVVPPENAHFFQAEGKMEAPKNNVELLQRAIIAYEEHGSSQRGDDVSPWPPITELNQLVKYRILRVLPAAPPGQKFVLDPKTRKVTLAPK